MKRIKDSTEKTIRDIHRATRKRYSSEEKIRIVLEGLRGEDNMQQNKNLQDSDSTAKAESIQTKNT